MKDWNNHWSNYKYDGLSSSRSPKEWADVSWFMSLEILSFEIDRYLDQSKLDPRNVNFLEVGCGSAVVSRFVLEKFNFQVYAVDRNEIALSNVKNKAAGVNLSQGDLMNLEFDSGFFHIVYSGGVFEYLDDLDSALIELHRVTNDNGIILANIVPRNLNIQIIGDVFFGLRALVNSSYPARMVPSAASSKKPNEYLVFFHKHFGLSRIIYYLPFPELPLPGIVRRIYGKLIYLGSRLLVKLIPKYINLNSYFSISALFVISAKRTHDE